MDEERVGDRFPEFRFVEKIGHGGFGAVYRAEHRRLHRPVAVKLLAESLTCSEGAIARFEREMAAVGKLDHPGIVRAFDAGERDGQWFLVMEFVEGADFGQLSAALPLPVAEACEMARQAALALGHAHGCGLVHRDVKPRNLMLARDGVVKVVDFGLAQLAQPGLSELTLTASGEFLGSLNYIAPEQVESPGGVDARADIYGLGATLYRLLTGHAPHGQTKSSSMFSHMKQITSQPVAPVTTLRPELPVELAALVDRMVALDREARPANAAEVVALLTPFCADADLPALAREWAAQHPVPPVTASPFHSPSTEPTAPSPAIAQTPTRTRRKYGLAAVLTGVLLPGAAVLVWQPWQKPARGTVSSAAPTAPPEESWQDITRDRDMLQLVDGAEDTAEGLRLPTRTKAVVQGSMPDGAIRIRSVFDPRNRAVILARNSTPGSYGLMVFNETTVRLQFWDNQIGVGTTLRFFPAPRSLRTGQAYELELRMVGQVLSARLDGQFLGSIEDTRLSIGGYGLAVSPAQPEAPPVIVRSLEVLELAGPKSGGL